jgi:hypothetical protein
LINAAEVKPLADSDSLEVETSDETTSEEIDPVLQYTFGMDTYRAGFNKGSISTNTLEECIWCIWGQISTLDNLINRNIIGVWRGR